MPRAKYWPAVVVAITEWGSIFLLSKPKFPPF